eukprot:scaffold460358_cov39-Prasinocladus_malaysianus.AAC.2
MFAAQSTSTGLGVPRRLLHGEQILQRNAGRQILVVLNPLPLLARNRAVPPVFYGVVGAGRQQACDGGPPSPVLCDGLSDDGVLPLRKRSLKQICKFSGVQTR